MAAVRERVNLEGIVDEVLRVGDKQGDERPTPPKTNGHAAVDSLP